MDHPSQQLQLQRRKGVTPHVQSDAGASVEGWMYGVQLMGSVTPTLLMWPAETTVGSDHEGSRVNTDAISFLLSPHVLG